MSCERRARETLAAWCLAQPGLSHALLGARSVKQVEENARTGEVTLDAAAVAAIRKAVEERL